VTPGRAAAALAVAALARAGPVQAHLVETGFGDFYDGVAHLAMSPADLLVIVAFALLAGQGGAPVARRTLLLMPLAWLAGGAIGAWRPVDFVAPLATTLTFGAAGALVALRASLPTVAVVGLAVVAGALHGHANGATLMPGGANASGLAGAVALAFCLLAIVSAQVTVLRAEWARIGVRVAGSWLAAAALLMVGWLVRGG
jgi:urease accessory protein